MMPSPLQLVRKELERPFRLGGDKSLFIADDYLLRNFLGRRSSRGNEEEILEKRRFHGISLLGCHFFNDIFLDSRLLGCRHLFHNTSLDRGWRAGIIDSLRLDNFLGRSCHFGTNNLGGKKWLEPVSGGQKKAECDNKELHCDASKEIV